MGKRIVENGPGTAGQITVETYAELVQRYNNGEIPLGIVPSLLISLGFSPITLEAFTDDFKTDPAQPPVIDN